ncbi:MAG: hypothetical protein KDC67_09465, partial [Ignavibacteriae bacterium]|nr:hypothetical protein [Ignavibacteriota bacterium]
MKSFLTTIFLGLFLSFNTNITAQIKKEVKKDSTKIEIIDSSKITLTKTNGDVFNAEIYYTTVNQKLAKPFSVKVQYKEKPLSNIPAHFEFISIPPKDSKTKIYKSLALTDTNGIAQT